MREHPTTPASAFRFDPRRHWRTLVAFMVAAAVTAVAGSVVQTQINLSAIAALGAPLTPGIRLMTTAEDVATFGPIMLGIAALALIPAFAGGSAVARWLGSPLRPLALTVAGFVGIWCAFHALGLVLPLQSLFGATRAPFAIPLISAGGLAGGFVFAAMTRSGRAS